MSDWWHGKMETITEDTVRAEFNKQPRKRSFAYYPGVKPPAFEAPFIKSIKRIFDEETGITLEPYYEKYRKHLSDEEMVKAKEWQELHKQFVFLRDCLSLSIALDFNFVEGKAGEYTPIGDLVHRGKNNPSNKAVVEQLAVLAAETINALPFYKNADFICAVPSRKPIELPGQVTALVSKKVSKPNITGGFVVGKEKRLVKESELAAKWNAWNESDVSFNGASELDIEGKSVVLIDDLYQSGTTIQFVAMKLQEAGARQVCGLSLIKTWRDTDNKGSKK